jgi:hypothetical protein
MHTSRTLEYLVKSTHYSSNPFFFLVLTFVIYMKQYATILLAEVFADTLSLFLSSNIMNPHVPQIIPLKFWCLNNTLFSGFKCIFGCAV